MNDEEKISNYLSKSKQENKDEDNNHLFNTNNQDSNDSIENSNLNIDKILNREQTEFIISSKTYDKEKVVQEEESSNNDIFHTVTLEIDKSINNNEIKNNEFQIETQSNLSLCIGDIEENNNKNEAIKKEIQIDNKPNLNIGIEDIVNTLKDFKNRILWDENIKEMEIMEEFDNSFIIHTSYNKPIFFISERDIIEKKVDFYFNNKYYSYSSSVSDELNEKYKENEDVMRILNYISVYIIEEDEENFYFKSLNQLDYKMNIPNTLMNITLPMKIINWYKKLEKAVKK
jgi:hypothetical protein